MFYSYNLTPNTILKNEVIKLTSFSLRLLWHLEKCFQGWVVLCCVTTEVYIYTYSAPCPPFPRSGAFAGWRELEGFGILQNLAGTLEDPEEHADSLALGL